MEIHAPSRHVMLVSVFLLPVTMLLVGCGSASRPFGVLAGNASAGKEADLASGSAQEAPSAERNFAPDKKGDVALASDDQEPITQPEVAVASVTDEDRPVRSASHSEDVAVASLTDEASPVKLASHSEEVESTQTMRSEVRQTGTVEHVDASEFSQQVLRSDVPVLVDFYADWCGPCRALTPTLDRIARETPNARVVKVNIDDSPQVAKRYGVKSIPTVMVFKNGEAVARHTGLADESSLLQMLDQ
jgi:thioredoxin 1